MGGGLPVCVAFLFGLALAVLFCPPAFSSRFFRISLAAVEMPLLLAHTDILFLFFDRGFSATEELLYLRGGCEWPLY